MIQKLIVGFMLIANTVLFADTSYRASTTQDPNIANKHFSIMISYLPKEKLFIEADAWKKLLEDAARDVANARLSVKKENKKIELQENKIEAEQEKVEAQEEKIEHQKKVAVKVDEKSQKVKIEAEKKVKEVEATKVKIQEHKIDVLQHITQLRDKRTAIADKLELILVEINERIGTKEDGTEKEEVLAYRRYIHSVGGVNIDLTDSTSAMVNIKGWLKSDQGGLRWLENIAMFFSIIIVSLIISYIIRNGVRKASRLSGSKSKLLNDFLTNVVNKLIMLIGTLVALSALEINVGPIMAIVGAAGFVVAFALQSTLSNFASGIMMMIYRPFDIGDIIDITGIQGHVKSMNLVSTTITTLDNRLMVIPNNSIWEGVITNVTASDTRRVDMSFGIGYADDISKAQNIMQEILRNHPLVLKEPSPTVKVHELADSSVNFICRPWVNTADYWDVYWEVTRGVKERFDAENISIPFPQSDIHLIKD
ncbi:MAG: mechanosensitive ion channel [Campylobacterota bacterium]|nr:mechanosensitive ion channel [Campylobacterota bacterium]